MGTGLVQAALLDALRAGDGPGYVAVLAESPLAVPVRAEPTPEGEQVRPVAVELPGGTTAVPAYTSADILTRLLADTAGASYRIVTFLELVEHWPEPGWVLAIDPGLPTAGHLPGQRLGELADRVFAPANEPERAMVAARRAGEPDALVGAVLRAELHLPLRPGGGPSRDLTDPEFPWWTDRTDAGVVAPVFTSERRLRGRLGVEHGPVDFVIVDVHPLAEAWPDPAWTMAVNPGTPMAATFTGELVADLAQRLRDVASDPLRFLDPGEAWWSTAPGSAERVVLQVVIPHQSVGNYLGAGYDRVAGRVHLCPPPERRMTPAVLYLRLGLLQPGAPFTLDDKSAHVIRWRPADPRAQEWLADPAPRTAAAVLPGGAELIRVHLDGSEQLVAAYDAGNRRWVRSDEPPG